MENIRMKKYLYILLVAIIIILPLWMLVYGVENNTRGYWKYDRQKFASKTPDEIAKIYGDFDYCFTDENGVTSCGYIMERNKTASDGRKYDVYYMITIDNESMKCTGVCKQIIFRSGEEK
jgi:hypothetical protein